MNITSIIAEYNPLHNGHLYHIEKTKSNTKCDGLIIIISGNFVQRGEPAIIDKWRRTELALLAGADLVLELPTVYAVNSAEFFAFGSVSLLNQLNCVKSLSFGSEEGSLSLLHKIAATLVLEPDDYKSQLKALLDLGISFPAARAKALMNYYNDDTIGTIINQSNNILSIEYLKALKRLNSPICPTTVKRLGGSYNSTEMDRVFSSATSIRTTMKKGAKLNELNLAIPSYVFDALFNDSLCYLEDIYPYLRFKTLTDESSIKNIPDAKEGLENRILKNLIEYKTFDDFSINTMSKRYPLTRINRILTQYFIGFEKFDTYSMRREIPAYGRILGFNDTGKAMLKIIKKNSNLQLISKVPQNLENPMLRLDIASTKAYSIINSKINPNEDYLKSPIII
ncbi:nucleotidyltransferase [Clostridium cellulovorans]|uniref:tRNA(Met) cytidine acetate ligase n=1 Tax=Clostridium cellulovorans (strain ATCC 35296 / DSM 3052 / OCM 3 / 743B) TaxID=573061 RepID=D9SLB8_CLOC7|nr:nucleotidyltransferase [Clostridium cellulovorans]ADL51634.1 protein of unknown function DUF795 [Clostridium cellulovorans 743B]